MPSSFIYLPAPLRILIIFFCLQHLTTCVATKYNWNAHDLAHMSTHTISSPDFISSTRQRVANSDDVFMNWFQSQEAETVTPLNLTVGGKIPSYLQGRLLRMGPTLLSYGARNYTNFLDGFGRISSYTIDGQAGTVSFLSRILETNVWNTSKEKNDIAFHMTVEKTEPAFGTAQKLDMNNMDNTDVQVFKFPGSNTVICMTDYFLMNAVDFETLAPLGSISHEDDIPTNAYWSASHPGYWINPKTDEGLYVNWLGSKTARGVGIKVYTMGSDMKRTLLPQELKINYLTYSIHSLEVLGDYALIIASPVELEFLRTRTSMCISCSAVDHLDKKEMTFGFFPLDLQK